MLYTLLGPCQPRSLKQPCQALYSTQSRGEPSPTRDSAVQPLEDSKQRSDIDGLMSEQDPNGREATWKQGAR